MADLALIIGAHIIIIYNFTLTSILVMRTLTTHSMLRVVLVSVNFLVQCVVLVLVLVLLLVLSLVLVILTIRGAQIPGSGPS